MSNQINHRRPANKKNLRRKERPVAYGCAGEGHNGVIGRTKWKVLSRRSERRNLGTNQLPKIRKYKGRPLVFDDCSD